MRVNEYKYKKNFHLTLFNYYWWSLLESNQPPTDYESVALTDVLRDLCSQDRIRTCTVSIVNPHLILPQGDEARLPISPLDYKKL